MSRPRWRNPDKRMARAVELRAQGWSLRRIGAELAVSEGTIRLDLARWERLHAEAEGCVIPLRKNAPTTQRDYAKTTQLGRTEEGA
jgi:orotate phosphoribosyltransferase-like protein